MASPSPECVAGIVAAVPPESWDALTDPEVLATLQAGAPNPVPQGTVPPPLSVSNVLPLMGASLGNLAALPTIVEVRNDIRAQDHAGVANWAVLYHAGGHITEAEKDAVLAFISTPVPDPSWRAEIPWDETTFGRSLDLEDIAAARSAYLASLTPEE